MYKTVKDEGKKHKDLIAVIPIMPCQNPLWIMGSGEGENLDSSEFTYYNRFSGTRSRIERVYTDIKIANNTKINHIMVSFTDHNNAISLGSLQKLKLEKIHGTLIIFFYVNPSSPQLQRICCFFLIKTQKKTHSSASDWWQYKNSCFKRMLGHFLKIPPLKKILEFEDWKKDYETSTIKKTSNQKLNQWLETWNIGFII